MSIRKPINLHPREAFKDNTDEERKAATTPHDPDAVNASFLNFDVEAAVKEQRIERDKDISEIEEAVKLAEEASAEAREASIAAKNHAKAPPLPKGWSARLERPKRQLKQLAMQLK